MSLFSSEITVDNPLQPAQMYKELTKEEIDQIEHNQNYGPENTMEKAQISSTDLFEKMKQVTELERQKLNNSSAKHIQQKEHPQSTIQNDIKNLQNNVANDMPQQKTFDTIHNGSVVVPVSRHLNNSSVVASDWSKSNNGLDARSAKYHYEHKDQEHQNQQSEESSSQQSHEQHHEYISQQQNSRTQQNQQDTEKQRTEQDEKHYEHKFLQQDSHTQLKDLHTQQNQKNNGMQHFQQDSQSHENDEHLEKNLEEKSKKSNEDQSKHSHNEESKNLNEESKNLNE